MVRRNPGWRLISVPHDELAVSVITIAELRAGVLAATDLTTRDRRLHTLTAATALALDIPVLTQDDGFPTLDELRVLHA